MKDKSKYTGNELRYLKQVLKSDKLGSTSGNFTYRFEQEFAKSFQAKYAIACNSGTSALHMALEGVGVNYGAEVVVPALSVIMNTTSILHCNAIPVYVDVDENTFTINPSDVLRKITPKTKAIVTVSLYGYPSKIEELKDLLGYNDIPIIEDNAEHLGNIRSEAAVYSLESTKCFSAGEMGVVATNDMSVALKARLLSNHGFKNTLADNGKTKSDINIFQDPDYERHTSLGWNYRTTEFNSAIALAQLERKEEIILKRKSYACVLYDIFDSKNNFKPQHYHPEHTYWTFVVRCLESKDYWRKLHKKFIENGGDGFWSAWQLQYNEPVMRNKLFHERCPELYKNLNYKKGLCPVAEMLQPQLIQLKLNYRSNKLFLKQVKILKKVLKYV